MKVSLENPKTNRDERLALSEIWPIVAFRTAKVATKGHFFGMRRLFRQTVRFRAPPQGNSSNSGSEHFLFEGQHLPSPHDNLPRAYFSPLLWA